MFRFTFRCVFRCVLASWLYEQQHQSDIFAIRIRHHTRLLLNMSYDCRCRCYGCCCCWCCCCSCCYCWSETHNNSTDIGIYLYAVTWFMLKLIPQQMVEWGRNTERKRDIRTWITYTADINSNRIKRNNFKHTHFLLLLLFILSITLTINRIGLNPTNEAEAEIKHQIPFDPSNE